MPSSLAPFPHRCGLAAARGLGLVEVMICLALVALVATLAGPSLRDWLWRQRLAYAAQAVLGDLQLARGEAIQGARNVILRFGGNSVPGGSRCYVLHTGPAGACDCRLDAPPACEAGAQPIKQMRWPAGSGQVEVTANVSSMLFSGRQGTVSVAGTIEVRMAGVGTVRHVVSITGRVRSCTPDGALNRLTRCA